MTCGLFITGTDTGVGKTVVACALLRNWAAQDRAAHRYHRLGEGRRAAVGPGRQRTRARLSVDRTHSAFCGAAIHAKISPSCDAVFESRARGLLMPGAEIPPLAAECEFCVVSRRNDSLGSVWRWRLFASLCVVSFGLALGFTAFGAWMVLPYSALEMAVLYLAFRWIERHAADWERVSICGDRVIVEREQAGTRTRREFNRYWTRVEVEEGAVNHAPRLKLWFAGQGMSFGDEMSAAERAIVARDLRRTLSLR